MDLLAHSETFEAIQHDVRLFGREAVFDVKGGSKDCVTDSITGELIRGGRITLPGFGTFSVGNRKARTGRPPRAGQEIRTPAARTAKFKAGKALKEAVR